MMPQTVTDVSVRFDVPCTLSDGTVLRANVFSPVTDEAVPVLLLRHPYSKDNPFVMGHMQVMPVVRAGYIVAVVDVRGRFTSQGTFAPTAQEASDGAEVVRWAAALPGSDGTVGGWGASYGAETQWSAALGLADDDGANTLKTIVPVNSPSHSHFRGFLMRGGAHELGSRLGWSHNSTGLEELRRQDPSPEGWRAALRAHAELHELYDSEEVYRIRPLKALPSLVPFVNACMESFGEPSTAEWRRTNMTAGNYDRIDQSVFVVGGWFDVFLGSTLAQYRGVLGRALETGGDLPHLVIGPWSHLAMPDRLGDVAFGTFASSMFPGADVDLTRQHIRWFDATLKGRTERLEGVRPVRLFIMGSNEWVGMSQFPPAPSEVQEWHLGAGGTLAQQVPDAGVTEFDYDPEHPVRTLGGPSLMSAPFQPGPFDQSELERRDDVLSFTSEPLAEDVTVVGDVTVTLFATSSAVDTDFVARLCDVHPDGRSIGLADGIIRASAREGDGAIDGVPVEPTPIEPGRMYEYTIDLWATAATFAKGHRIRVDVTSSSFPRWDPNPNTGSSIYDSAESVVAYQTVHHGPDTPTRIHLPVVSNDRVASGDLG